MHSRWVRTGLRPGVCPLPYWYSRYTFPLTQASGNFGKLLGFIKNSQRVHTFDGCVEAFNLVQYRKMPLTQFHPKTSTVRPSARQKISSVNAALPAFCWVAIALDLRQTVSARWSSDLSKRIWRPQVETKHLWAKIWVVSPNCPKCDGKIL